MTHFAFLSPLLFAALTTRDYAREARRHYRHRCRCTRRCRSAALGMVAGPVVNTAVNQQAYKPVHERSHHRAPLERNYKIAECFGYISPSRRGQCLLVFYSSS